MGKNSLYTTLCILFLKNKKKIKINGILLAYFN